MLLHVEEYFEDPLNMVKLTSSQIKNTKLPDPASMGLRCPRTSFGMTQVINYHMKNNIPKCANFSHTGSRLIENVYFS